MGFSENWKKAGQPVDEFDPPDGLLEVRIVDGGAFAGKDGREWSKVELEVAAGEHEGRRFEDWGNLNNDVGLRIARENYTMYGVDSENVEELEDLDTALVELIGTRATVSIKHSESGGRTYMNVKVISSQTGQSDIPTDRAFPPALTNGERRFEDDVPATASATDDDPLPY